MLKMIRNIFFFFALASVSMPVNGERAGTEVWGMESAAEETVAETTVRPKRTDANIVGHVKDRKTGDHLPHVTVSIAGTTLTTFTDATGHYFFKNLPVGEHTIEVKYMGYRSMIRNVTVDNRRTSERRAELAPAIPSEEEEARRDNDNTIEENFLLEEDNIALDEVVVSSNRSETKRRQAPSLVSVIGEKVFNITQSPSLCEGLSYQPGVRTEDDCQNCGFTQVRINGLDGHYSQILIDSRPVFSALNGVYGLEQIPANMIDRVEVVRGGGSALFGASAIGGTINIITKEPLRNTAEIGHNILNVAGSSSFDNVTTANASLVTDDNKAGLFVYGQSRNRQGYDHDGDGYTEIPVMRSKNIGVNTFLRLSPYSKLAMQYNGINEFRRGGNALDQAAHFANVTEQTEHDINGMSLTYNYYSRTGKDRLQTYVSFLNTDRKSYYGGIGSGTEEEREAASRAYGNTSNLTYVVGAQYIHQFGRLLFMPSDLTVGAEYTRDALHDIIVGYDRDFKQTTRISSAYLQNEWKNKTWSFLVGGRIDKHNLIDGMIFSPRVNVRYNPTEDINLRASYSDGFRAPQAYDEDLHVGVVGGERLVTVLADNLKEERSHSFSLSADMYCHMGKAQGNILVEGFCTLLNDVFALRQLDVPDAMGNIVQERYNAYGAKVYGVNIEGRVAFSSKMQIQAGMTVQRSEYDEEIEWNEEVPEQKYRRFFKTPQTYGYFTATYSPIRRLDISLTGNYTGRMLVGHSAGSGVETPEVVETPAFFVANAKVAYSFPIATYVSMEVAGGVQNIFNAYQKDFDKGWNRDSNYVYGPSLPRSIYCGVKISY